MVGEHCQQIEMQSSDKFKDEIVLYSHKTSSVWIIHNLNINSCKDYEFF